MHSASTGKMAVRSSIVRRDTVQLNVENSAQANEQLFRSIFENAQLGISFYNIDGRAVFSNHALHQMLGYTAEELSTLEKWDEIVHPEERSIQAERYADIMHGMRDTDEYEERYIHRDGHVVISQLKVSVAPGCNRQTAICYCLVEDITERKRAQEGMKANEQLFRSIFENAQIGIAYFKIDTQEHISNRALHEMLGYSGEELSRLGQWDEIVAPEERASGAERYAALIEGKRDTDEYEQHFIRRDGRIVVANDKFQLLRDAAGKPQYIVCLAEDITERKRAQEERSRLAKQMEMLLERLEIGDPVTDEAWYRTAGRTRSGRGGAADEAAMVPRPFTAYEGDGCGGSSRRRR